MMTGSCARCGGGCIGYNSIEAIRRQSVEYGVVAVMISRAKNGLYRPDHAVLLKEWTESGRRLKQAAFLVTCIPNVVTPIV